MISFIQKALTRALILVTIPFIATTFAHAGTLGSSTSYYGSWSWSFSYENMTFTRANITIEHLDENGDPVTTIIAAPTFDITENPDSFTTDSNGVTTGTGSALFKGILKVTHGPAPEVGEAWAEVQMQWPEVEIIIDPEAVSATGAGGDTFTFLKESRIYKVVLNSSPDTNTDKLTDGFKRVVPELPHTGVYAICDGTNTSYLCEQEIGYGTVAFNPSDIFQPITAASGLPVSADTGFYWDEVCLAFQPEDLNVQVDGQDYNLKEDDDGYFRSCEGRSVVFNACTPDPSTTVLDADGNKVFNCNDINEDGEHFTFILADAAAGDRLEPAPATTCVGTEVADWLALAAYADSGEDLIITPCDPNQGNMLLPYTFSDSSIYFTTSEGDGVQIDNLQIISIGTRDETGTAVVLQESPDKTDSNWDFSNMLMNNISFISSLELNDTVTGTAGTDVLLGGNGTDSLNGYSGNDCIDGQQNDDNLWGDGHALNHSAGTRGADVFVLTSKLGKDNIHDFSVADGDKIVNVSGSSADVTPNGDGTFTVALKGQNYVIVNVLDGALEKGVNVIDADGLSGFPACKGHPLQ